LSGIIPGEKSGRAGEPLIPGRKEGGEKMMRVIRMVTTRGNKPVSESYKMEQLYAAAGSVFALPKYEQVLAYLESGPEPEPPDCVKDTPGGYYAVGRMISANGAPSVMIRTDGGREVIVEPDRVLVFFRTATRDASTEAAREVLEYLHQHTGDEICILELTDGRFISDADIAPEEVA